MPEKNVRNETVGEVGNMPCVLCESISYENKEIFDKIIMCLLRRRIGENVLILKYNDLYSNVFFLEP